MPLTDEDIVRDLLRRYTADVYPDASVAATVAARQRRREIRRRAGTAVAAGAALGVAAGVIAIVPARGNGPAAPATAEPGGTASGSAPAITPTASQRVLYRLSAAAARQQPARDRYVTLYEKTATGLATTVIDTYTGGGYTYVKGGIQTLPHFQQDKEEEKDVSPTAAEFAAMPLDPAALRDYLISHYEGPVMPSVATGPRPPPTTWLAPTR